MKIDTSRFGRLEIDCEKIILFKLGIPGFEHLKEFVLLSQGESGVYFWLQSVSSPETAFLAANPFVFFPGYDFEIPEADVSELELENPSQALVLVLVTIPLDSVKDATVNLLAPVVINTLNKKGKQVVLDETEYKTRHLLFSNTEKANKAKKKCGKAPRYEIPTGAKMIMSI